MLGFYASTSKNKMKWARVAQSPEKELVTYDVEEVLRKYFPLSLMWCENLVHRNLVMN